MIELLRELVENQKHNNKTMIEATKEIWEIWEIFKNNFFTEHLWWLLQNLVFTRQISVFSV